MIGVGDLVVCVDVTPQPNQTDLLLGQLREGRFYRVSAVGISHLGNSLVDVEGIARGRDSLKVPNFRADRFRKIERDKHEACEDDFAILLKLSKHRVSA